jgi:hypothetical protein
LAIAHAPTKALSASSSQHNRGHKGTASGLLMDQDSGTKGEGVRRDKE